MAWALGVCLLVHACAFVAVSYFGQIVLVWFLTLGAIASLTPGSGVAFPWLSRRSRRNPSPAHPSVPSRPVTA